MHKTVIPRGDAQHWHYKNHLEACYCVAGAGILTNLASGEKHWIFPDTVYVLDDHDDHTFQAIEETVLISVFNPPVTGQEIHDSDGSYTMMNEKLWSEYDSAAEWCARRGIAGRTGDPLPHVLSAEVYHEITEHPEKFKERVRETAYKFAMESEQDA